MDRLNRYNANYFIWINDSVISIVKNNETVLEYSKIVLDMAGQEVEMKSFQSNITCAKKPRNN